MLKMRSYLFVQYCVSFVGAVLLYFSSTATASSQSYKVPASGQVTFALTQFWLVNKGPANQNLVQGDATVTVAYAGGQETQIAFQGSGTAVWEDLEHAGYIEANGTTTWTQVAYLNPGTVFQIISSTPAGAYDPTKPFEGGQLGAYVQGFVSGFSVAAPPLIPPSGPSTSNPPPPPSAPPVANASANIHAVIISALSDPAKVIVSSNVTLTGGIVALGKNGSLSSTTSAWSPGLKIVPDYALLTGEKIPPVTPNIIDVRIVRQDVTAGFPSPSPNPDN
jgi:hypothetical protein